MLGASSRPHASHHKGLLPTRSRTAPPQSLHRDRYSIAFFCHPNKDAEIACIDTCASADNPARYAPISAGDHLLERLNATY